MSVAGDKWLAAALSGGLPEPVRERWQPLRVGIVNLWEYDNAEFWFADGRLVLRGGNGAGKTKVLELTTLMLLRGEIIPSVLDPFGTQHRTMRFNLLATGEADDPRPVADTGLGYAWVEFGRRDERGQLSFLVAGLGASARRGSGTATPSTWQFITTLRPGKDLALVTGDRVLDQKELRKVDGVAVLPTASAYRARLADELYGLTSDSYDNLTELLKQLRKPKLGERLNPGTLAQMLRDALPPLATHEVDQLADGWDHLEKLRRAVEKTEEAATAVARFLRYQWRPWAQTVVRRRADAFTSATTDLDNTTREKNKAVKTLADAKTAVTAAESTLGGAKTERSANEVRLRELLESQAYRDAVAATSRVEQLRHTAAGLRRQRDAAENRRETARAATARLRQQTDDARREHDEVQRKVELATHQLLQHADPAGLADSASRHLLDLNLDALLADQQTRAEQFTHLGTLDLRHQRATAHVDLAEQALETATRDRDTARTDEDSAMTATTAAADLLRAQVREWAATAIAAPCPDHLVEDWCDAVANLTVIDPAAGVVVPGKSVTDLLRTHVRSARSAALGRQRRLELDRQPLDARWKELDGELTTVRNTAETSPPEPAGWRRRQRPAAGGTPFWRAVAPRDPTAGEPLARLEAALAAAGLLDAWISADGVVTDSDGRLLADVVARPLRSAEDGNPPTTGQLAGNTLLAVLEPVIDDPTIRTLLGTIAWFQTVPRSGSAHRTWFAADGSWQLGGFTGRAEPVRPASYLGAAAREAARQRRIAQIEAALADLTNQLNALDTKLVAVRGTLDALDRHETAIPEATEREVERAVTGLAERTRLRQDREAAAAKAEHAHKEKLTKQQTAWAAFADYAAAHRFGLRDLSAQGEALRTYRTSLEALASRIELLAVQYKALQQATRTQQAQEELLKTADGEVDDLTKKAQAAELKAKVAAEAIGTDQQAQLSKRDALDEEIARIAEVIETAEETLAAALDARGRAESALDTHESRRADAESTRDAAMAVLWMAVDAGLTAPLGLAAQDRHSVQAARELAASARRALSTAADEEKAWLRCYDGLTELRQRLLQQRDARVRDDEDTPGGPHRVQILADSTRGWQPPHEAADALAAQVQAQKSTYDTEQQRVLTTLLGSTFIEHLKERLDYTVHTFTRINDQLARHPTRHGHVVRVRWHADPADPDAEAVIDALSRGYHQLSAERQNMVRTFLARRIEAARADGDRAEDWKDRLSLALDYRHWLRLTLEYRSGSGGAWSAFDAARHATKSGGEKVVLLSQPLFSAAVVAYDAAAPTAPRWVWLDEAMTGVDAAVKASFMGLTVDFQLDVMLTAHDEWCTYATVPAVAIYDLAREAHLPGVDAMPYLWCGGELTTVDVAPRSAAAPAAEPDPPDTLFAELTTDE